MWGQGNEREGAIGSTLEGKETATAFDKQGVGHSLEWKGGREAGRSISFDFQPTAKTF